MKTKPDQSDLLSNLVTFLDVEKVSKSNFFFAGFDSLTEQGGKVLEKLILNGKNVVVGAIMPDKQKNSFVYDSDIMNKLSSISRLNKIAFEKIFIKQNISNFSEHILTTISSSFGIVFSIHHFIELVSTLQSSKTICMGPPE